MDDAGGVRLAECLGDLRHPADGGGGLNTLDHPAAERFTFDELHRDVRDAGFGAHVVDVQDVRVVQR
jgi:hypothetical protein